MVYKKGNLSMKITSMFYKHLEFFLYIITFIVNLEYIYFAFSYYYFNIYIKLLQYNAFNQKSSM